MGKGPGRSERRGISLLELGEMFPDDEAAEKWFIQQRWPNGIACAHCGSLAVVESTHPTMPFRCKDCRKFFSVKTNSLMHSSNISYRKWAFAFYIVTTNIKGTSSMKLHRDINVTQKTAWYMAHRIREAFEDAHPIFSGPVEVDETFVGGLERNKHSRKKLNAGRGTVGKAIVIGILDRRTGHINAMHIEGTDKETLQGFVESHIMDATQVYTDDHSGYIGLPNHKAVKHSVKNYVEGQAHTNGIESFWAMLKRGYMGTYHKMSFKHLHRYITEFYGRHNSRPYDTIVQMGMLVRGMHRKRLKYADLIA